MTALPENHMERNKSSNESSFVEKFIRLPPFIKDRIFEFLTVADFLKVESLLPDPNVIYDCERVITYKPEEIIIKKDKILCQKDQEGIELTHEQFVETNFKIDTAQIRFLEDLTNEHLDRILQEFRGRVHAYHLYVFDTTFFAAEKFAEFIESIGVESLYIGNVDNYNILENSMMHQIKALHVGADIDTGTDFMATNKFETLRCSFVERISLESFRNIIMDWGRNERIISDWQISGINDPTENVHYLFGNWKIVEEIEFDKPENENLRPIVVSTNWFLENEFLYKVISRDGRELFIKLKEHDDHISITDIRPEESELSNSEIQGNYEDLYGYLYDDDIDQELFDDFYDYEYDNGDISLNSTNYEDYYNFDEDGDDFSL